MLVTYEITNLSMTITFQTLPSTTFLIRIRFPIFCYGTNLRTCIAFDLLRLCLRYLIDNLITYLLILRSAQFTIRSLITEPYNKLIDSFMFSLFNVVVKNKHQVVRGAALYTSSSNSSGAPGSVKVSKISCTSIPAQCKSKAFFPAAFTIAPPSTFKCLSPTPPPWPNSYAISSTIKWLYSARFIVCRHDFPSNKRVLMPLYLFSNCSVSRR